MGAVWGSGPSLPWAIAALGAIGAGLGVAYRVPLVWTRRREAVLLVAAASAAGAVLAPGRPTGLVVADGVLRGGWALVITLAGARARRWAWVGVAGGAALASIGEGWVVLACLALGLGAGASLVNRRGRLAGALIGGAVAQVLLRLPTRWPTGTSALVAAAGAGLLIVSGWRLTRRRTRRPLRWAGWVLAGLALGAAGLSAVAALRARPAAEAGLASATAGTAAAKAGDIEAARSDLHNAEAQLSSAQAALGSWWAQPGRVVPGVAQNLHALQAMTTQALRVLHPALTLSQVVGSEKLVSGGRVDLAALSGLTRPLQASLGPLDTALGVMHGLASPWLVGPLSSRLDDLQAKAARVATEVSHLAQASRSLPGVLGAGGPRRYLLIVQDPSESRATGGIIGDWGILTAVDGRLSLDGLGIVTGSRNAKLSGPIVQWAAHQGFKPQDYVVDAGFAPDFPTVAGEVEQLAADAGLGPVDGVISVDPFVLAEMLQVIGPVSVPHWPTPITSANAVPVFLHDQYLVFTGQERYDFLLTAARTIFNRFTALPAAHPSALIQALTPGVAGGHLLLYANRSKEEALFGSLGATGAMGPIKGDWLEVVNQNGNLDKIDWYLRRQVSYRVSYDPATGRVNSTVTVVLHNGAPSSGQPAIVIGGPGFHAGGGDNYTYMSLYTALHLVGASVGGRPVTEARDFEKDRYVYTAYVDIPAGQTVTVSYHLAGYITGGATYSLRLAKQPTVAPDQERVSLSGVGGWRVVGSGSAGGATDGPRSFTYHLAK